MPNWIIHKNWAKKAGIPGKIAEFVDRSIDYGSNWLPKDRQEYEIHEEGENENNFYRQLVYFYDKDSLRKNFVKACYLHHLLDYFKETYVEIYNIELVFQKFLQQKAIVKIKDKKGNTINFKDDIEEIFQIIRDNKTDLFKDLRNTY
jgi:hypothetical protein